MPEERDWKVVHGNLVTGLAKLGAHFTPNTTLGNVLERVCIILCEKEPTKAELHMAALRMMLTEVVFSLEDVDVELIDKFMGILNEATPMEMEEQAENRG